MGSTKTEAEVGLFLDGAWVDAITEPGGVRVADPISVRRGRSNWSSRPDPATATFTLDNRDGRWSPDNPSSPHYGHFKRNIPTRVGARGAPPHLAYRGTGGHDVASTPDTGASGSRSTPNVLSITPSSTTVSSTSHSVDLPVTVAKGNRLILMIHAQHSSLTTTDLDDWLLLDGGNIVGSFSHQVYTRVAKGDEGGTSIAFTTGGNATMSAQVYRLDQATQGWEIEIAMDQSDSFTLNPNPPAVTTFWGAESTTLFIAGFFAGASGGVVTANPAGYTAGDDNTSGAGVWLGTAHRSAAVETEDPGTFTIDDGTSGENVRSFTIALRGGYASVGTIAQLDDLDVRFEFQLDTVEVDPQTGVLANTYTNGSGWVVQIFREDDNTGALFLKLQWGTGISAFIRQSSAIDPLPYWLAHDRGAVRVVLDTDNGAGGFDYSFYYAETLDGPWTLIGSVETESGPTFISGSVRSLAVGGRGAGLTSSVQNPLKGRLYAFQLMQTIGGATEVDADFEAQAVAATSFVDTTGRTWTLGADGRITDIQWLFHGELSSIPVRFDTQARDVRTPIEAAGIFRRLRRARRLGSAMTRLTPNEFFVVRHWPMEEVGSPTQFAPALPRSGQLFGDSSQEPVKVTTGSADAAASNEFLASDGIPTLGLSTWTVNAPTYTDVLGGFEVRFNLVIPDTGPATNLEFLTIVADTTWRVEYRTDSGGQMRLIADNGITGSWSGSNLNGQALRVGVRVAESGANVSGTLIAKTEAGATPLNINTPSAAGTAGPVQSMTINTDQNFEGVAFGQLSLFWDYLGLTPSIDDELSAWSGERAAIRIMRLCDEEGIEVQVIGDPSTSRELGPQLSGTLMSLIEEAADTDLGILFEPRQARAVGYRVRSSLHDQTATIDADYAASEVASSPNLDRDDAGLVNDVTATNWNGSEGRALLADGSPLSISEPPVGAGQGYDESFEVNANTDSELDGIAQLILDRTAVDEPRISSVRLALHAPAVTANTALADSILAADVGDIIDIRNMVTSVLPTTLSQIVQGLKYTFADHTQIIDLLTDPGSPYASPVIQGVFFRTRLSPAIQTPDKTPTLASLEHPSGGTIYAGGAGTTHNITTQAEWNTARAAAAPGDILKITAEIVDQPLEYRGNRFNIGGTNASGTAGNPIVIACEGAGKITITNPNNGINALGIYAVEHVWLVGVVVEGSQHGIYFRCVAGSSGNHLRMAHCTVTNTGNAAVAFGGWFQTLIGYASAVVPQGYGGSTDAGEWGFSEWILCENNTIQDPGQAASGQGECLYFGNGNEWSGYCVNVIARYNTLNGATTDWVDIKPGCSRLYFVDNECSLGHFVGGSGVHALYVASHLAARPSWYDFDPEVYIEGNRLFDGNVTNTDGSSSGFAITAGLCGLRINNNIVWGISNGGRGVNIRIETTTEAPIQSSDGEIIQIANNLFWTDIGWDNQGYGTGSPTPINSNKIDARNNIGPTGATGVEFTATSADFVDSAAIPTVDTVDADAEWETYGQGSAFDLDSASALVSAGSSVADLDFYIDADITQRPIPTTSPNPGPFQPVAV